MAELWFGRMVAARKEILRIELCKQKRE